MKCTAQVYPAPPTKSRAPSSLLPESPSSLLPESPSSLPLWQVTSGGQEQYDFQVKCTAQVYPNFYPPLVTSGDQTKSSMLSGHADIGFRS